MTCERNRHVELDGINAVVMRYPVGIGHHKLTVSTISKITVIFRSFFCRPMQFPRPQISKMYVMRIGCNGHGDGPLVRCIDNHISSCVETHYSQHATDRISSVKEAKPPSIGTSFGEVIMPGLGVIPFTPLLGHYIDPVLARTGLFRPTVGRVPSVSTWRAKQGIFVVTVPCNVGLLLLITSAFQLANPVHATSELRATARRDLASGSVRHAPRILGAVVEWKYPGTHHFKVCQRAGVCHQRLYISSSRSFRTRAICEARTRISVQFAHRSYLCSTNVAIDC